MQGIENTASKWTRISTATTTQISTADSILDGIILPHDLVGTLTIYDDPDSNDNLFADYALASPAGVIPIGAYFTGGIRVVTGGADEVIILWREIR